MSKSHWTNLQGISALAPNLNPWARILSEQLPPPSFWLMLSRAADSWAACTQAHGAASLLPSAVLTQHIPSLKTHALGKRVAASRDVGPSDVCCRGPGRLAGSLCCSRTPAPCLTPLHPSTLPAGCHSPSPSQEGIWQGEPASEWSVTLLCVCVSVWRRCRRC